MTTQGSAFARLTSKALDTVDVHVRAVRGEEHMSQLFDFEVDLVVPEHVHLDLDAILAEPTSLSFGIEDGARRTLHGAVTEIDDLLELEEAGHSGYRLRFAPRTHVLGLGRTIEAFVDTTVPAVLQAKLVRAGFEPGKDFELRLGAHYPKREFIVQYNESDLDFLSRLAEHLGIAFWFEHGEAREVLVFSDELMGSKHEPVDHRKHGGSGVRELRLRARSTAKKVLVDDYDYNKPSVELWAAVELGGTCYGEYYEYGSNFTTGDEARWIAKVRGEEINASRRVYTGKSDVASLGAGSRFELLDYPRGELTLFVTRIETSLDVGALGAGKPGALENRFDAIDAKHAFRPPRRVQKPRVPGYLTGTIEGQATGPYAPIDDQGRYRVRLLCDCADTPDGKASLAIRMSQPHAGQGYGMHFPLRPGVEVLIAFIDGDPDRPVIAGCVPNPRTPSPVTSDNNVKNVIRTGAGNEIHFDDTQSGPRIKMSTPHKNTTFQMGSPNYPEEGAVLATEGAVSSIAGAGHTMTSDLSTTATSTLHTIFGGRSIISYAGFDPKWPFDWGDKIVELGSTAREAIAKVDEAKAQAVEAAKAAFEAAEEATKTALEQRAEKAKEDADAAHAKILELVAEEAALPKASDQDVEALRQAFVDAYAATNAVDGTPLGTYAGPEADGSDTTKPFTVVPIISDPPTGDGMIGTHQIACADLTDLRLKWRAWNEAVATQHEAASLKAAVEAATADAETKDKAAEDAAADQDNYALQAVDRLKELDSLLDTIAPAESASSFLFSVIVKGYSLLSEFATKAMQQQTWIQGVRAAGTAGAISPPVNMTTTDLALMSGATNIVASSGFTVLTGSSAMVRGDEGVLVYADHIALVGEERSALTAGELIEITSSEGVIKLIGGESILATSDATIRSMVEDSSIAITAAAISTEVGATSVEITELGIEMEASEEISIEAELVFNVEVTPTEFSLTPVAAELVSTEITLGGEDTTMVEIGGTTVKIGGDESVVTLEGTGINLGQKAEAIILGGSSTETVLQGSVINVSGTSILLG